MTSTRPLILIAFAVLVLPMAKAQTFEVIHSFTGGAGGANPWAGLTIDKQGNLYGTAINGGSSNLGLAFKLTHEGPVWIFNPLYSFTGAPDGLDPEARLVFGPNGTLYGTTASGGKAGRGAVYNLRPPGTACKTVLCPWAETVLYSFTGYADGSEPGYGALIFDQAGTLYGTTTKGGTNNGGVVYTLTPTGAGWIQRVIYNFDPYTSGIYPYSGVIFDGKGNLYGTASTAGGGSGTVYQLTPSGSDWVENTLFTFSSFTKPNDGAAPYGGLIFDESGNLYGSTTEGGLGGGGTVFELTPVNGGWAFTVLYSFSGGYSPGPDDSLTMDAAGNLYGTTYQGGANYSGVVFKLSPSGGSWTYTDLHDFCSFAHCGDGQFPQSGVVLDANGNLYGTAHARGIGDSGVVWEIAP